PASHLLAQHRAHARALDSFPTRRSSDLKTIAEFMELGWLDRGPGDIFRLHRHRDDLIGREGWQDKSVDNLLAAIEAKREPDAARDRKSTRLNSSHVKISYAVFCLKKKRR